jgi:hypothetical protein
VELSCGSCWPKRGGVRSPTHCSALHAVAASAGTASARNAKDGCFINGAGNVALLSKLERPKSAHPP